MPVEFTDASGLPILRRNDLTDADIESGVNPFTTIDDLLGAQMISPSWMILGANAQLANGQPATLLYGSRKLVDTTLAIHPPGSTHVADFMTRLEWLTTTASTDLGVGIAQLLERMKEQG